MHKKNYIRKYIDEYKTIIMRATPPQKSINCPLLLGEEILERCKQILNCNLIGMILLWVD